MEIYRYASKLDLLPCTSFIKDVQNVPSFISVMDVVVQSSLSESFSNVLLEYMAAGKPIVATRVGDAEKMIDHEKTGLLVTPGASEQIADAVLWYHNNPELARSMGLLAKSKVAGKWSEKIILRQYESFYENIFHRQVDP